MLLVRAGCGSLSITTPASLLANELDVRSVLHGLVSVAAVNQICVIHEANAMLQKSEDSLTVGRICEKIVHFMI